MNIKRMFPEKDYREERPLCGLCDYELVPKCVKDNKTNEIKILFYCDGSYEDQFVFEISTGLYDHSFDEEGWMVGEKMQRTMTVELLKEKHDEQCDLETRLHRNGELEDFDNEEEEEKD